jgi:hypothetical protein
MLWREENKRGWLFNERNTISDVELLLDDMISFVLKICDDVNEVYSFCN